MRVQRRAGNPAFLQRAQQRCFLDDGAARRIEEERRSGQRAKLLHTNHPVALARVRQREHEKVETPQKLLFRAQGKHPVRQDALGVTGAKRSPLFPAIPTIPEATGKSFDARSYFALLAPGGTPKAIREKLQAAVAAIMAEPDFRRRHLIERGLAPVASTPDEFAAFIRKDRALAQQIVKEAGLEPQ